MLLANEARALPEKLPPPPGTDKGSMRATVDATWLSMVERLRVSTLFCFSISTVLLSVARAEVSVDVSSRTSACRVEMDCSWAVMVERRSTLVLLLPVLLLLVVAGWVRMVMPLRMIEAALRVMLAVGEEERSTLKLASVVREGTVVDTTGDIESNEIKRMEARCLAEVAAESMERQCMCM